MARSRRTRTRTPEASGVVGRFDRREPGITPIAVRSPAVMVRHGDHLVPAEPPGFDRVAHGPDHGAARERPTTAPSTPGSARRRSSSATTIIVAPSGAGAAVATGVSLAEVALAMTEASAGLVSSDAAGS